VWPGEGLVGDCGLVFPGADPGFQVIGGVLKKFSGAKRDANIFGVFCVKNQDFMQKIIFFPTVKQNVLTIVLIIVNINKDENKSLISNQFSLKNDFSPTSWRTILRR